MMATLWWQGTGASCLGHEPKNQACTLKNQVQGCLSVLRCLECPFQGHAPYPHTCWLRGPCSNVKQFLPIGINPRSPRVHFLNIPTETPAQGLP